jgi:hypothetical protein
VLLEKLLEAVPDHDPICIRVLLLRTLARGVDTEHPRWGSCKKNKKNPLRLCAFMVSKWGFVKNVF